MIVFMVADRHFGSNFFPIFSLSMRDHFVQSISEDSPLQSRIGFLLSDAYPRSKTL